VPFRQGKTVADVNRESCRKYATARARASGTVRRELGVLRAGINHAHRSGRLTRIVAVELPDGAEPRDRWLTKKEAAALLRSALREPRVRLHLPLFILIGLYTGQRKAAILSLRWSQVDLDGARIDFTRQANGVPKSGGRASPYRASSWDIFVGRAFVVPTSASSSMRMVRG